MPGSSSSRHLCYHDTCSRYFDKTIMDYFVSNSASSLSNSAPLFLSFSSQISLLTCYCSNDKMSANLPAVNTFVVPTVRTKFKESDFTDCETLGEGSEAIVYRGFSGRFGIVAVKMINRLVEINITDFQEVDLLIKHSGHPHIVHFFGLLVSDYASTTCRGYVMEFMPLGSLHNVIHNFTIPYDRKQIITWMLHISLGLGHLHSEGIIHRDIKPKNLLLGETLNVLKISDFGTARCIGPFTKNSFTSGTGTFYYMAPEIMEHEDGHQKYSFSADIYSFAITLWEISRRKVPYNHIGPMNYSLMTKILRGVRPEMDYYPDLSGFDGLIRRGWNPDPARRPNLSEYMEFAKNSTMGPSSSLQYAGSERDFDNSVVQVQESFVFGTPQVPLLLGGHRGTPFNQIFLIDAQTNKWKRLSLTLPYDAGGQAAAYLNGEINIFSGADESPLKCAYKLNRKLDWERLPDMNERREGITSSTVVFNGSIWAIGGWNCETRFLNSVEAYDPKLNSWITKKGMNVRRWNAVAAVVKRKIFVCGGESSPAQCQNTVEYFDAQLSKWIFCTPMPAARAGMAAVAHGEFLTVMGGSAKGNTSYADVWRINVDDRKPTWTTITSMKIRRTNFSAAMVIGKIIVAGGKNNDLGDLSSVETFDEKKWTRAPALCNALSRMSTILVPPTLLQKYLDVPEVPLFLGGCRNGYFDEMVIMDINEVNWKRLSITLPYEALSLGAAYLNGEIYIFGGFDGADTLKTARKLNQNMEWTEVADMSEERRDISNSSVVFEGSIWVIGEYNANRYLKTVEAYDPRSNAWIGKPELNIGRSLAAAGVANGKIFVCGGYAGKYEDSVEVFDSLISKWIFWTPMPAPRYGLAAVIHDGFIVIMGGNGDDREEPTADVWKIKAGEAKPRWVKMSPMTHPRTRFSAALLGNEIMVAGGWEDADDYLSSVEIWSGEKWKNGDDLPDTVYDTSATLIPYGFAQKLLAK